jgi:hypothetical protein
VRLLKIATASILLAIWLPATSLCLLEQAFLIQKDDCCPGSQTPCSGEPSRSACCSLAAGNYKIDHIEVAVLVPVNAIDLPLTTFAIPPPDCTAAEMLFCRQSWQFLERAAWPARAPSFAS